MKSVKIIKILMRVLGLWYPSGKLDKYLSNLMLSLVLSLMIFSVYVQSQELYYSRNSIKLVTLAAPSATAVLTETSKLIVFINKRKKVAELNKYLDYQFGKSSYSGKEQRIFNNCDIFCFKSICICTGFMLSTCFIYVISPIIGMVTNDIIEFPFPMRFAPSLYSSPIFELYFILELLATVAVGLCISTFVSYMLVMNLFTAAQFQIFNVNLTSLCNFKQRWKGDINLKSQNEALRKLKIYITRHQMLIDLIKEIEDLYCYIILQQVFGSVSQTCFLGIQVLLVESTSDRLFLSILFLLSSLLQFYLYCYSSHAVFQASENVFQAIYFSEWFRVTHPRIRKEFMQLMRIVAIRAEKPCVLTVGKFYPLTMATFMSVIGTSMSYFTVLRRLI